VETVRGDHASAEGTFEGVPRLRCVFYDPDVVDPDAHLTALALEASARAEVEVFALAGDEDSVFVHGEEHDVAPDVGAIAFVMRACAYEREECIGVGAALADAPVGAVWVGPLDIGVRGPNVRVAEDDEQLLYDAVISELAQRR
jgi:hypothetical protein